MNATPRRPLLIVEDTVVIGQSLADIFRAEGFEPVLVTSGTAALQYLMEAQQLPALILLDLGLPGMNGATVRRALESNEQWRTIPVVVLTASRLNDTLKASLNADAYLEKPVSIDRLLATIMQHARASEAA